MVKAFNVLSAYSLESGGLQGSKQVVSLLLIMVLEVVDVVVVVVVVVEVVVMTFDYNGDGEYENDDKNLVRCQ